jgi:haloalkane dehalogenase
MTPASLSLLLPVLLGASACTHALPAPERSGFPYEPHFVQVLGSRMHYVEEGKGDPILLIHGNPTSSYLWRNVIPHLASHGRVIAVDLIGMGKSDKPRIGYRFADHYRYLAGFIEALGLRNVTLVVHDWGSALGFAYGMEHEGNVRGIAFMEALTRPMTFADFPDPMMSYTFGRLRDPRDGRKMITEDNFFLDSFMPMGMVRTLSEEERAVYHAPYLEPAAREPVRVWPTEIPIDGKPADVQAIVVAYARWLERTPIPKLLVTASPGMIITAAEVARIQERHLPNLEVVNVGEGLHYVQEDQPDAIGRAVADWYEARVRQTAR